MITQVKDILPNMAIVKWLFNKIAVMRMILHLTNLYYILSISMACFVSVSFDSRMEKITFILKSLFLSFIISCLCFSSRLGGH